MDYHRYTEIHTYIGNKNFIPSLKFQTLTLKLEVKYKKYRNILTLVLKNAKRRYMYFSNIFGECKDDTRKTWQTINQLLRGQNDSVKTTDVEKINCSCQWRE